MPTRQDIRKVAIVFLAGPIKFWWNENWETDAHWHYDAWREALRAALIADGSYLTIAPWQMCKGTWTERAQALNDAGLAISDVILDLTPPGVPSEGTVSEIKQASSNGKIIILAPPPARREDFTSAINKLIKELEALGTQRDMVDQEEVLECIGWQEGREWLFEALAARYEGHVFRVHHYRYIRRESFVQDFTHFMVMHPYAHVYTPGQRGDMLYLPNIAKVEVLNRLR